MDIIRRNFFHKSTLWVRTIIAKSIAFMRSGYMKLQFCSSDCDIHKATFFFDLTSIHKCPRMRENPFFRSGNKYMRKLETFRKVDCHERYSPLPFICCCFTISILIRDESNIFEKKCDILRIEKSIIARCHIHEFIEIFFFSFEFLFAIFSFEVFFIVRTIDDSLHQCCDGFIFWDITECLIDHDKRFDPTRTDTRKWLDDHRFFRNLCDIHMFSIHNLDQIFERFFSDFSTGHIDDTLEWECIFGIIDKPYICEDIFDFFAFIELHSSVDSIRDIFADKRLFDESRLTIGSVEYGEMGVCDIDIFFFSVFNIPCDKLCLMLLIESFKEDNFFSFRIWSEERLLHLIGIVFYYSICRFDDHFRRTIILFEIDHFRIRVVFFEIEDIRNIRTTPGVDSLPVISHDTKISRLTRKNTDDIILKLVGILVLIDHKILESSMKIFDDFFKIEHLPEKEKKVIEIECVFFSHLSYIGFIHFEDDRSEIAIDGGGVLTRTHSLPFCSWDEPVDAPRIEFFFIDILTLHDFFHCA